METLSLLNREQLRTWEQFAARVGGVYQEKKEWKQLEPKVAVAEGNWVIILEAQEMPVGQHSYATYTLIRAPFVSKDTNDRIRELVGGQSSHGLRVIHPWWPIPHRRRELRFQERGVITDLERLEALLKLFAETLNHLCAMGAATSDPPHLRRWESDLLHMAKERHPQTCEHRALTPRWDSVADMGLPSKVTEYRCESCGTTFSREEAERRHQTAI
jgi:hypothetical protein